MSADRSRIKFEGLELTQLSNGRCTGRVTLTWHPGDEFVGTSEGIGSQTGLLRCAAEATLRALNLAVGERITLELLGVKTIKAFDAMIVVVSLSSRATPKDHEHRVAGSCVIKGNPPDAAVRAVLTATNRVLGDNIIHLR